MPLDTGSRLGPYEILGPLGAGGMGEVYRARDTKLDRDVAIKVLPPDLAESPAALARFEREAKAVAALSHPNILAIFDFGAVDPSTGSGQAVVAYAVMELLEGATLREKLAAPIPVRKAIDYAIQIARGLAAAHDKGIVHRDLKPENVFVTADGRVKILDFGLARHATAAPAGHGDATISPTIESATLPGIVMGTVGYMSPEQARGEPGDHRSDLFAFGAVLYEMVSGRRAFQRETAVETLTATLREDPAELSSSPNGAVSPAVARVIQHCLEKNPVERFQSARDVAFALDALSGGSASTTSMAAVEGAVPTRAPRIPVIIAAAVAIAAAAAAFYAGRSTAPRALQQAFTPLTHHPLTVFRALFAPDGKTVVYSAALTGNTVELFTVSPEYPESKSFGLRDVQLLSVSSKSELAVLTHARYLSQRLYLGTLARMPLGGGAPREILENVREADWSPDGEQLALIRSVNGSDRLEFPAGKVLFETTGYISDLRVSPDGTRIAFFEHPAKFDDRGSVAVVDLAGKKTTLSDGYSGLEGLAWSRDGRDVLFSDYKVYAVTLSGVVRQLLASAGGMTLHDVSADGRWLASRDDVSSAVWVKPPGGQQELNLSWLDSSSPRALSRDGRLLLFTEFSGVVGNKYATVVRKTDGSPVVRLGEGSAQDLSPDGSRVVALVPGERAQLVVYPTGAGEVRKIDQGPIVRYQSARWFADSARLLICGNETSRPTRCYVQDAGGGPPRAITPDETRSGLVSPDGSTVVARRGDAGVVELYPVAGGVARAVPGIESDDLIVRWGPDGRSLLITRTTLPPRVEQLDVQTGTRTVIPEIAPTHADAGLRFTVTSIADDPAVYAYTTLQRLSSLFMVKGAQ